MTGATSTARYLTILLAGIIGLGLAGCGSGQNSVVVYCAQDQAYAEPIFQAFERETGLHVRAVFDSEAVKTVGLANRLLAERNHAQCDVFWGNEEMRARQLEAQSVFREPGELATFGSRSRRMVINTNLLPPGMAPRSLLELTNAEWRGRVALAYPQFGTTATHFHALRNHWGAPAWESWCRALAANKPFLVDGNSVVVRLVGSGEATVGLTDSDDVAAGQREGLPLSALPLNQESLLIPNVVAIIRGAPHRDAAEKLAGYLQRPEVAAKLVAANALESAGSSPAATNTLRIAWRDVLRDLETTTLRLNEIFLR